MKKSHFTLYFFFQAEDGIRDGRVTGVQTCALPIFIQDQTSDKLERRSGCGFPARRRSGESNCSLPSRSGLVGKLRVAGARHRSGGSGSTSGLPVVLELAAEAATAKSDDTVGSPHCPEHARP